VRRPGLQLDGVAIGREVHEEEARLLVGPIDGGNLDAHRPNRLRAGDAHAVDAGVIAATVPKDPADLRRIDSHLRRRASRARRFGRGTRQGERLPHGLCDLIRISSCVDVRPPDRKGHLEEMLVDRGLAHAALMQASDHRVELLTPQLPLERYWLRQPHIPPLTRTCFYARLKLSFGTHDLRGRGGVTTARDRAYTAGEEGPMPDNEPNTSSEGSPRLTRRQLLRIGASGAAGAAVTIAAGVGIAAERTEQSRGVLAGMHPAGQTKGHGPVGSADTSILDPAALLTEFETGRESRMPDGRLLREFDVVAVDREIEVAPGIRFPAWTYNGRVPGPTIRATEGDRIRVAFRNAGSHAHTIHFHGTHAADMDGVFEVVAPGQSYVYEFDAEPFGLHLYHCHVMPLKRHIHKGLYGVFLVDPRQSRPAARELVMVMNGFDTNFDGKNEVYAVNSVAFAYEQRPISIRTNELVRVYLVNMTEFDLVNSFHLHGNFFRLYRTGTDLERFEWTDTAMQCQGERAILEFAFRFPGRFMFHAHQSEFAELGWMGMFDVRDEEPLV
jgi:FtsP/CotA-like multicopper oxidase with cupredoxin domain